LLRKTVSGLMLALLFIGMLTSAFTVQPVKAVFVERKVGVNVGDWVEYKNYTFSWKSNVPFDELGNETKSFIKNHENLYSLKVTVLDVSGTIVNYESLLRFKNGTEWATQTLVDVETGSYSNMWFIAANLSAGDSIYVNYPDWIISETFQSVYLGESREVNLLSGKTTSYTSGPYMVSLNFTIIWDRLTGILLEWYGSVDTTENINKTVTYHFHLTITGTSRWGYRIWIVDDDGPADFQTIQEAINAANQGDTIFVRAGTYHENLVVNKSNLTLIGENKDTVIIDGGAKGTVIHIISDFVIVSGFTIRNSKYEYWYAGVTVEQSVSTKIINNIITNCFDGVLISKSLDIMVVNNTLLSNKWNGVHLKYYCHFNQIVNNAVLNNRNGISIEVESNNNYIFNNYIEGNELDGLDLMGSSQNTIVGNTIANCFTGIYFGSKADNLNIVYHNNFINNYYQVTCYSAPNTWDDGYPSGGNYWSDYIGVDLYKGPYQNETGSDGIGDTPYVIDENNVDHYPLMKPWTPKPSIINAIVDIQPQVLNLRSRGKWITAYIELSEGYDVSNINVSTIMLNDTIPVEPKPIAIGDYDNDTIPDLMVKFDRQQVINYIMANVDMSRLYEERFMTITLTITGKLNDGTQFQGSGTIKIILPIPRCWRLLAKLGIYLL